MNFETGNVNSNITSDKINVYKSKEEKNIYCEFMLYNVYHKLVCCNFMPSCLVPCAIRTLLCLLGRAVFCCEE